MNLCEMTWPSVDALDRDTPVVFPIAALEQHGRHMPLFTDSLLLAEIVRRVTLTPVAANVLFAPLQWLGNSHHHLDMPGTLSASPRCYVDLLHDLAECFLAHRFRRIVFLNGHGGNAVPSQ
jgi:creatinine amidohydrolase